MVVPVARPDHSLAAIAGRTELKVAFVDLSAFFAQLDAMHKGMTEELYVLIFRKLALDIHGRVVVLTPRDTGRAQNGWAVSVRQASAFQPPEGAEKYGTAGDLLPGAIAALNELKFGDTVYITNNVVYILKLNDGHSKRAPAKFIELALSEGLQMLDAA